MNAQTPNPARRHAWTVICCDQVRRVRFVCARCGFENVNEWASEGFEPLTWTEAGTLPGLRGFTVGQAVCLYCGYRNAIKVVGRYPDIWEHGSVWIGPKGGPQASGGDA